MKNKIFEIIYWVQVATIFLVAFGFISRLVIPYLVLGLIIYFWRTSLENSVFFFVRSIPFFVAIPLTMHFDSFNTWRILSILIFLKWLDWPKIKSFFVINKKRKIFLTLGFLFLLMLASILVAPSFSLAIKRAIYFVNLGLIGIVICDLVSKSETLKKRIIKNISIPIILVTLIGFFQLVTTYMMDIYQFVDFWGRGVELRLFGQAWSDIALQANTWFAYFGSQLSLRMFSIFPDSHSFPTFLLIGLPALVAIALMPAVGGSEKGLGKMIHTRGRLWVIFLPLVFLALILSGTRGIWVAGLGVAILGLIFIKFMRYQKISKTQVNIFKYIYSYLAMFFLLFSIAIPIFASPQFLVSKDDATILGRRFRSIIDAGETSNKRRLEIWRASLDSIIKKPLLGVGVGNFPVVLGEDLAKSKAGSTAHNLYLHIAAETGVLALIASLYFIWLLLRKLYLNFIESKDGFMSLYYGAGLLFIPWMLIYSMTDAVLFDERAFLIFAVTAGIVLSEK